MATFLSSWSILTSAAVYPIISTFSVNVFPATWTTLIYSSVFVYHTPIAFCFVSTFDKNDA
jgi:hypothetical protein